ncbi:MAG TPA: YdeI/OmpD-associated family protein [Gemmatimonadaceae bacterium]|nr:YdeI/OmpD-associated family protein [Gemmatimonadaceae bacterium]
MKEDYELKSFETPRSFETWLSSNHAKCQGIRIKFAKKASGIRSIRYAEALEIALCYGWIDGQANSIDDNWYSQRFTPRRTRSLWSKRNRDIVARLIDEGRMQPAGQAEIDRAQADGRWAAAYDSPAKAKVPDDLTAALRKSPAARRFFESLDSQNRYAILHRLMTAKKPETRAKRLATFVEMLREGRKIHS